MQNRIFISRIHPRPSYRGSCADATGAGANIAESGIGKKLKNAAITQA
jgi:hypothetical protein